MFENAMKKAEENKKAAKQNKKKAKSKDVKEEVEPTPKEVEPVKMKTHEEIYRELKKKRKIKNIELQEDIGNIQVSIIVKSLFLFIWFFIIL